MFSAKRQLLTAVAACAIGLCAASVRADSSPSTMPSNESSTGANDQLQQKVEQLEAKVATLETQQTQTQAQVNDSIQKVMADADSRSKLLDSSSVTTGYDTASGFHIASDDGNFFLHPWALFQFEGVINYRTSVTATDTGEVGQKGTMVQDGFDIRRAELGNNAHRLTPIFEYFNMV
jgi:hypothetical protein